MLYTEHQPAQALTEFLECIWFMSSEDNSADRPPERILPDGCVEWIFHLGAPFQRLISPGTTGNTPGKWELQPRSFVVGELTRFLLLQPTGSVDVMGVRFRPGRAYRFLPFPLMEFTDQTIFTGDIWGSIGTNLEEAVLEAPNDQHRQQLIEEFLLNKLTVTGPRRQFDAAVNQILLSRGQIRIHDVSNGVGWSSRQLERHFRISLGLSPKSFARVIRFQNLLRIVGEGTLREWANLALEGGYADQPHMVREFREFAGQTPAQRDTETTEFSSAFVSPRRLSALLGRS
jgi:AraC-like DNA-binding protein